MLAGKPGKSDAGLKSQQFLTVVRAIVLLVLVVITTACISESVHLPLKLAQAQNSQVEFAFHAEMSSPLPINNVRVAGIHVAEELAESLAFISLLLLAIVATTSSPLVKLKDFQRPFTLFYQENITQVCLDRYKWLS